MFCGQWELYALFSINPYYSGYILSYWPKSWTTDYDFMCMSPITTLGSYTSDWNQDHSSLSWVWAIDKPAYRKCRPISPRGHHQIFWWWSTIDSHHRSPKLSTWHESGTLTTPTVNYSGHAYRHAHQSYMLYTVHTACNDLWPSNLFSDKQWGPSVTRERWQCTQFRDCHIWSVILLRAILRNKLDPHI